ncbi:MAG TPA: molybdenum cofactor biosynthesis protein MoaE [Acidobacteriaceae bacterium]|jgi:molybdopterin synthase catalytic subunit|nr:molybdenum cofactor biosynthesis protein MoaE [Acidobacteriaceae bacterium]
MRVHLLTFGVLRDHLGETGAMELPAGSTVRDLVEECRRRAPEGGLLWSSIAVAVNREYASNTLALKDGDEVALLPPVSGGAPRAKGPQPVERPKITLTEKRIDTAALAESLKHGEDGAVVVFDGIVRNNSRGRRTRYLFYEAYETMALQQMEQLASRACADFPVRDVAIVHRLGRLEIGETSVAIAVASAHRAAAFDACRWLIDTLKQSVPIWKKEFFEDGAVWAQGDPFPAELTPQAGTRPAAGSKKRARREGSQQERSR